MVSSRTKILPRLSPGPWKVMKCMHSDVDSLVIVDTEGGEVARARGWCGDPDPSLGNAHAISATTDLIAACEAFVACWAGDGHDHPFVKDDDALREAMFLAHAALAKAGNEVE